MPSKKVEEIFDAFSALTQAEQDEVIAHLMGIKSPVGVNPPPEVSDEFKRIASEVFDQNHELFKKLAD
ncbi:MAG: hypothetical protein P4N60_17870 [Verrucomicrobiae bacterium]|nr:hypothetical protein [Verrucomicrobiae bacterium]